MKKFKQFITEDTLLTMEELQPGEYYEIVQTLFYYNKEKTRFRKILADPFDIYLVAKRIIIRVLDFDPDYDDEDEVLMYNKPITKPVSELVQFISHKEDEIFSMDTNDELKQATTQRFYKWTVESPDVPVHLIYGEDLTFKEVDQNDPLVMQDLF